MPVEGGDEGECRAGGAVGQTAGCSARTAQTARSGHSWDPTIGRFTDRVPCLRIPRKGRWRILPRSFTQPYHGKQSPKRRPPPPRPAPVLPLTGLPGPSHCPQGLTTSLAGRTAT